MDKEIEDLYESTKESLDSDIPFADKLILFESYMDKMDSYFSGLDVPIPVSMLANIIKFSDQIIELHKNSPSESEDYEPYPGG